MGTETERSGEQVRERDAFDANARAVLRVVLFVISTGALLYLAATALVGPESWLYNALIVGLLLINGAAYGLYRAGRTAAAGALIVSVLWLVGVYPTLVEGLNSTAAINFLLVTVVAGVVVSGRAALLVGGLSGALLLVASAAESFGWIHPAPRDIPPLTNGVGRALQVAVVSVFLWMTARNLRRAFERVRESGTRAERNEARLAELVRETPDGIVTFDPEGVVLSANPAACLMARVDEEKLVGRAIDELEMVDPTIRTRMRAMLDAGELDRLPERFPLTLTHPDGAVVVEIHPRLVLRASGDPIVFATLRDVTAQREAEAERQDLQSQLERAQRLEAVGRLAGGMAHDFNNLLTALSAHVELIAPHVDTRTSNADLEEMRHVCARGADLTHQLLSFARPQKIEVVRLDVGAIIDGLTPMLKRLMPDNIALEVETQSAWAEASRAQLESVVVNLVVNARDAMPAGGTLSIAVAATGDEVELLVRDSGQGMDEATRVHIFEPFFTTKGKAGTGLGLSIVHGIIQNMAGRVAVNTKLGSGTTFRISLPLVDPGPPAVTSAPSVEAPVRAAREARLLVLEDEDAVRRATCRLLKRSGYVVEAAQNAEEARAVLAEFDDVALLISDIMLPGLSGPELAVELRRTRPDLRFLFVSGYADVTSSAILEQLGAPCLAKPYRLDALLAQVENLLTGATPAEARKEAAASPG